MITDTTNNWHSPVRRLNARVELYEGSTRLTNYTPANALKSFTFERVGEESKFFGFGICQKTNIHLIDVNREINITTANNFKNLVNCGGSYINCAPTFYVSEVHRDENTNELSITGYDALYKAAEHTFAELALEPPYTIRNVIDAIASLLGLPTASFTGFNTNEGWTLREYPEGANYEGTETLREVLDDIAEATQSIYYLNRFNYLIYKRMNVNGEAALTLTKEDYITLSSKTNRRLSAITSATELGDNVGASLEVAGTTQYVRDNPFWELREDIGDIVDEALAAVGGMTINQFECSWRGNYALEPGDKIGLTTKDNEVVYSYIINDVIEFNGGLAETTSWKYEDSSEDESNPSSLGEALKKTFARVDKVNAEVEIVAAETAQLKLDAESFNVSITALQEEVENKPDLEDIDTNITEITTTTGYKFDKDGLKITKSDSEINTTITQDGMSISKGEEEVLTASNKGVKAIDLHATTYLIIGVNSRIEDYADDSRTGCFWIGQ